MEVSNFHFVATGLPSVKNKARPGIESDYCDYRADWYLNPSAEYQSLGTTSSTAQGGGGSFKNRKPIGEIGCCESGMAERVH